MQLPGSVVVVTGAAGGIGKALAASFIDAGAGTVIAVDIDPASVAAAARELNCIGMTADVASESDILRVIEETEREHGPIDLFCSNAGVAAGLSEQSADAEWELCWNVNVMAHVYAARHLLPRMLARGGGHLLNTASAAGLLNQPGGAAYGVTKHAAVGFAEWLAMTYGHRGIGVSLLCPQAVRTTMTADMNEAAVRAASTDGMLEPEEVARISLQALQEDRFLILPHQQVEQYIQGKAADYDGWVAGMNRLYRHLLAASESGSGPPG